MTASNAADATATISCTVPVVNLSDAEAAAWRAWRAPIVVVDYHKGNLSSVIQGLSHAGAVEVSSSDDVDAIRGAAGVVLPGVGSFYDAIDFMAQSGEAAAVADAIAAGVPFLGICLGQQLLFERGDEGVPADAPCVPEAELADAYGSGLTPGTVFEAEGKRWVRGLGILKGSCARLDGSRLKVPHVGWDQVHPTAVGASCPLIEGFPEGANMYFTHSYALDDDVDPAVVAARTHYTRSFASIVACGNVFGCQFHPEKSSGRGLDILRNFVRTVRARAGADDVDQDALAAAQAKIEAAADAAPVAVCGASGSAAPGEVRA